MKHLREILLIFVFLFSSLPFFLPNNPQSADLINQTNEIDPYNTLNFDYNEQQSDFNRKDRYTQLQNPEFGSPVFKFTNEFLGIETNTNSPTGEAIFALSPDSKLMISTYNYENYYFDGEKAILKNNFSLYFWDLTTGKFIFELNEFAGPIQSIEISPDGLTFAITYSIMLEGISKTILEVRNFSFEIISELEICSSCYTTRKTAYSPNGELLALSVDLSDGYEIKIFSLKSQSWLPSIIPGHYGANDILFTPDSSKILFSENSCTSINPDCDNQLKVYDIKSKSIVHTIIDNYNWFNCITLSSNGSQLATVNGNSIFIWKTKNWSNITSITLENEVVKSLQFSKEDQLLFAGLRDSRIFILDLNNKILIKTLFGHKGEVTSLSLSADKTMLISAGYEFTIIIWNIIKSETILWSSQNLSNLNNLIFSENVNDFLALSYANSQINIKSVQSDSFNKIIQVKSPIYNFLRSYDVSMNKNLIVGIFDRETIKVWNSSTESEIITISLPNRHDFSGVKFSPDSSVFATLARDEEENSIIEFWSSTSFTKIGNSIIDNMIIKILFSPDGKTLASLKVENSHIYVIDLWNVTDGSKLKSINSCGNLTEKRCSIESFKFSPDGSTLVFSKVGKVDYNAVNNSISFWNYKTNSIVNSQSYSYEKINSFEFSTDGNYLFSISGEVGCCGPIETDGNLKVWKVNEDSLFLQNAYHSDVPIVSVAISQDGSNLAIGTLDFSSISTLKVFDTSKIPIYVDEDLDGINDEWEYNYNLSTTNFWNKFNDDDQDGLINSMEFYFGTNPHLNDTNGNGILDGNEFGFYPIPLSNIGQNNQLDSKSLPFTFDPILILLTLIAFSGWVLYVGIILYKKRWQKKSNTKTLTEFVNTLESSFIRTLYFKIVVGLENVKKFWFIKYPDDELEVIINKESNGYTEIVDLFPLDIQKELKSELRGRTILILIELAYQFPNQAHITAISKALEIPQATVSFEMKKLLTLQYIEKTTKLSNLQDTRFKYYSLTAKGTLFLHLLKESLIQGLELVNKPPQMTK